MKNNKFMDEENLLEKGISILIDKLGPIEAARFLTLSYSRKIDSVKRHHLWQKQLDKNIFFDQIFKENK